MGMRTMGALLLAAVLAGCGGGDGNGNGGGEGGSAGEGGSGGSGGTGGTGGDECPDSDGDRICDEDDVCPGADDAIDTDLDGLADGCDNCPAVANEDQADTDGIAAVPVDFAPEQPGANVLALETYGASDPLPIGFSFEFFGGSYDQFKVSANGYLGFSEEMWSGCCGANPIPTHEGEIPLDNIVFAGWTAVAVDASSRISWETRGEAPSRRLVVTWEDLPVQSEIANLDGETPVLTTQAILFEGTNEIVIHTASAPVAEGWLTRGIENADGTVAAVLPGENMAPVALLESSVRYTSGAAADGVGDACSFKCVDEDGDGTCDYQDLCPGFPDWEDGDDDGLPDGCDACPQDAANDSDGDGSCDSVDICQGHDDLSDADGDEVPDGCDPCPGEDDRIDLDQDGVGDACDACTGDDATGDADADGICDGNDVCAEADDKAVECPMLPMRGGSGGGPQGPFECPADTAAVGFELQKGQGNLLGAKLICLDTWGEEKARVGMYGTFVDGSAPWDLRCDDGHDGARLVGQYLTPDWILFGVGLVCRDGDGKLFTVAPERTDPLVTVDVCDGVGEVVTGMNLRLGGWMDAMQLVCH